MTTPELLIALLIVVGLPCATIIAIGWMFAKAIREKKQ